MSKSIKKLKCPDCKRLFLSGGIDQSGPYYFCTYCEKHFKKDLFKPKQKTMIDFLEGLR
ncbi:MAG: hypothetical protein ACFE8P_01275 [Promethearchaeota archaeon]